ncbi:TVP38/TMEM64 family protein [Salsuginibacillus kocurii]|uniref:TVP38/TMEM64 family protein n=1 Tax=Salsuginibacillus kocurii TaxID=427078 RepID=UPI00037071FB|nr:TVP38/TMEM64 family protein [Salsuginibacillus kocurii]
MNRLKLLLFIALIVAALAAGWLYRDDLVFEPEVLRDWILNFGIWAPLIYVILYTLRPLVLFPASIFSMAGGLAFGFWGFFLNVAGALGSAALAFSLSRWFGASIVQREWTGRYKTLQNQMEQHGFFYMLAIRLIPVLNFDAVSYLAGISKVRFFPFLFGTMFGLLPGAVAYTMAGSTIVEGDPALIMWTLIVFLLVMLLPVGLRLFLRKRTTMHVPDETRAEQGEEKEHEKKV